MEKNTVIKWLKDANTRIQKNKDYLSELDRNIGDGDHGLNMSRGFQEVINKLTDNELGDIGSVFQTTAMTLISKVGGASGPLYGTAFLRAATYLKGKKQVSIIELGKAFNESVDGLKQRGKAEVGQKTMIDVWEPVINKWLSYDGDVNVSELQQLCRLSMEATKELEATKGRAAYLGKRSIGHLDPGAVSSYIIFDVLFSELEGVE